MTRQQLFQWMKRRYGVEPDYPWADENAVLRHRDNNKWFALVMEVGREKLGMDGDGTAEIINLKCQPALIGSLRERDGFYPAYHMNKDQWLSVRLDGSVADDELKSLIDLSFELTQKKQKKGNHSAQKDE
ncbi:MmcQ/YjbR family DNA-binding protein [Lachnospiraceae bacterium 47-T17]